MKRKIISTVLYLIGLVLIGFSVLVLIGFFKEQEAGLLIETEPQSTVYINNIEVGTTPYETTRKAGEASIKIKPVNIGEIKLDAYETNVNLVPGVKTIIKRAFMQKDEDVSGAIVSFEKIGSDRSYVTVVSIPDNSRIIVDGKNYGFTPLRVSLDAGDHDLVVSKDGYLEKKLPIKIYKGFKLTASIKLAQISIEDSDIKPSTQEKESLGQIRINKTDVGFLRARSGANIGFPEVGRVKPDEVYDILEEGEHASWYKIKIVSTTNEVEGWVSSEFVTKI